MRLLLNTFVKIKTKLDKHDQLINIQEAIQFMSQQYDDILKDLADNRKILNDVEKENLSLKKELKDLKSSVKFLNDARVNNDCIVSGLKVGGSATVVNSLLELAKSVSVNNGPEI